MSQLRISQVSDSGSSILKPVLVKCAWDVKLLKAVYHPSWAIHTTVKLQVWTTRERTVRAYRKGTGM